MQILPLNSFNNYQTKLTPNKINFNGKNAPADTFSCADNVSKKTELTPYQQDKLRREMGRCISESDMEGLKSILEGEHVTLSMLRTAKRYYDQDCRAEHVFCWHREKPAPEIGEYIYARLTDAEMRKRNGATIVKNPYQYLIDHIRCGYNKEQYAIAMIRKTVEMGDPNLLHMIIETLRKEHQPYGEILIKALGGKKTENAE